MTGIVSQIERDNEIKSLLALLGTLYRPLAKPEDPRLKELLRLYREALTRFDAATLREGAKRVAFEWKYQRWPNPAELIEILNGVRNELYPPDAARPERPEALERPTYSAGHKQRIAEGLGRMWQGLKNGDAERMTEDEWFAWCKRAEYPERLKFAAE